MIALANTQVVKWRVHEDTSTKLRIAEFRLCPDSNEATTTPIISPRLRARETWEQAKLPHHFFNLAIGANAETLNGVTSLHPFLHTPLNSNGESGRSRFYSPERVGTIGANSSAASTDAGQNRHD